MPFRRSLKTRTSSQSPKRRSGSSSPTKENEFQDISELYTPPKMEILPEDARKTAESFRRNCLINADSCAVSGEGRSWCISPAVGPALQACHIIPQQHYHLYPDHLYEGRADDGDDVEFSAERLKQAWTNTWSNRNGILLMSHLHELFDARLFSIHPDTHRIRAFVPYDVITKFNGQKADLPTIVDRKALRHHYEMSCIENMAAQMPLMSLDSPNNSSRTTPGIKTPLSGRVDLQMGNVVSRGGDPSKRPRPDQDTTTQQDGQKDDVQEPLSPDIDIEPDQKRRRVDDLNEKRRQSVTGYNNGLPNHVQGQGAYDTMVEFLADVNWELRKLKAI